MDWDIAYHGCERTVEKSTMCFVFDWVGSASLDKVQQSRTVEQNGKENLCQVIARRARYSLE